MSGHERETVQATPDAGRATTDLSEADRLAEFAGVVARSSLGTPEALAHKRLGAEMRRRFEARVLVDTPNPPSGDDLMLAVGRHLQHLELCGAAELAYQCAAERGSMPAIAELAGLLDRQGRTEEAQSWYQFARRLHGTRMGDRATIDEWGRGCSDDTVPAFAAAVAGCDEDNQQDRASLVKSTQQVRLDKYLRRHDPDAQLWDIIAMLLVRHSNVRDAVGAGWHGDDDGLTTAIMLQIARAIMEQVEVQCERTDAPPLWDPAHGHEPEQSGVPLGFLLRWRPSMSGVTYWLRVKWRNHAAPSFIPKSIRSEILFVIANACFSAGALVDWAACGHQEHSEIGSWHSMGVLRFFEDISSRYTPPHTKEIAASFAELAEVDIAARIRSSVLVGLSGRGDVRGKRGGVRVIEPRKEQIISRVRRLAGAGEPIAPGSSPPVTAGRLGDEQTMVAVTDIRQRYGERVRFVRDPHIRLMCAVRGRQNTADLIDHAVRLSGGSQAKLRELIRTVLSYMDILTLVRR
jgi:hypothetical protein